mmetsp:Transcript_31723/g.61041  ORF Transcript_31723/g.61041 Transcript_31723/m.61041 type:complete len:287 (-) Transcript_31723:134-994(-)
MDGTERGEGGGHQRSVMAAAWEAGAPMLAAVTVVLLGLILAYGATAKPTATSELQPMLILTLLIYLAVGTVPTLMLLSLDKVLLHSKLPRGLQRDSLVNFATVCNFVVSALGQCFLACGNVLASVCILLWACCTVSCVHKYIPNTRDAPKPQQACDKGETRPETGGTEHVQANSPRIRDQPANNSLLEADEAPKSRVRRMSGFTLNIAALDGSAARSKTPTAPTPAKGNTIRRSLSNAAHLASPRRITRSLSACCVAKVPAASGKERRRSLLTGSPRMQRQQTSLV